MTDNIDPRVNIDPVRPFVLPTMPRQTFPVPEHDGPYTVTHKKTGRVIGTCTKEDREYWENAGYRVA